jgi:hypothetical protein
MQFKLEVEEVDDAVHELSKYRQNVNLPLVIQVCAPSPSFLLLPSGAPPPFNAGFETQ